MPDSIFFRGASRCAISIFPRCLVEFRKGEMWLTPGPYLEPDLVGLLPWLTGCSILIVVCLLYLKISLKAMRHVNRKLAPELEIHLFACSFGVLFFLDS